MNATMTKPPSDVRPLSESEAMTVIEAMPIDALAGMTRESVHALPTDARLRRRERLANDHDTVFKKREAAKLFGVTEAALVKWRNNYLKTGVVGRNSMPQSDFDPDKVRNPNDGRSDRGVPPRWRRSTLLGWGARKDVGKLDADFFPTPDKGGRPPIQPTDELSPYA